MLSADGIDCYQGKQVHAWDRQDVGADRRLPLHCLAEGLHLLRGAQLDGGDERWEGHRCLIRAGARMHCVATPAENFCQQAATFQGFTHHLGSQEQTCTGKEVCVSEVLR